MRYDLVCGQGRLEAFQQLNQQEIPAFVTEASESACLVMSLVENIARRAHHPIDLMREVGNMRARGYTEAQIGESIGVTPSWVSQIGGLLDKGEEKLIAAVESGLVPISMATEIAKTSDIDIQQYLAEAYQAGQLRGKKLSAVRQLLERRAGGSVQFSALRCCTGSVPVARVLRATSRASRCSD